MALSFSSVVSASGIVYGCGVSGNGVLLYGTWSHILINLSIALFMLICMSPFLLVMCIPIDLSPLLSVYFHLFLLFSIVFMCVSTFWLLVAMIKSST